MTDLRQTFVIPAKAGIQFVRVVLDPGLRRDDEIASCFLEALHPGHTVP